MIKQLMRINGVGSAPEDEGSSDDECRGELVHAVATQTHPIGSGELSAPAELRNQLYDSSSLVEDSRIVPRDRTSIWSVRARAALSEEDCCPHSTLGPHPRIWPPDDRTLEAPACEEGVLRARFPSSRPDPLRTTTLGTRMLRQLVSVRYGMPTQGEDRCPGRAKDQYAAAHCSMRWPLLQRSLGP